MYKDNDVFLIKAKNEINKCLAPVKYAEKKILESVSDGCQALLKNKKYKPSLNPDLEKCRGAKYWMVLKEQRLKDTATKNILQKRYDLVNESCELIIEINRMVSKHKKLFAKIGPEVHEHFIRIAELISGAGRVAGHSSIKEMRYLEENCQKLAKGETSLKHIDVKELFEPV